MSTTIVGKRFGRFHSCQLAIALLLPGLLLNANGEEPQPSPLIVVIDSGIASDHPVFETRFFLTESIKAKLPAALRDGVGERWTGWDFVESDGEPQDRTGHGTHVAGLVVEGSGPVDDSAPMLAMFRTGDQQHELAPVAAAFEAVVAMRKAGFDIPVVLCAFDYRRTPEDGDDYDRFATAFRSLLDSGVLCVCAAGNKGLDLDAAKESGAQYQVAFKHPALIAVAACADSGQLLADSNYGAASVALAAPGFAAMSAAREGGLTALSGSSQAAARVAGRLARRAAASEERDPVKLREWLQGQVKLDPSLVGRVACSGYLPLED
jgi:major intracellular serine protease